MKTGYVRWFLLFPAIAILTGCETGKNYQADVDSLNYKVSVLQKQLTSKDEEIAKLQKNQEQLQAKDLEIARLQGQVSEEQQAMARLENERREIADKLKSAQTRSKPSQDLSDIK